MVKTIKGETYRRKNSLRLRGFDYAANRIYFVTMVTIHRQCVFLDPRIAQATVDRLFDLGHKVKFNLYCYCLMPDHFHALIGPGDSNRALGEICGAFKSLSTHAYWQLYKGRLWQRRFFDHIIRNEDDFFETMEYIKLNPVRKGLVDRPEDWPYTGTPDSLHQRLTNENGLEL